MHARNCLTPEELRKIREGELKTADAPDVEAHLAGCDPCMRIVSAIAEPDLWEETAEPEGDADRTGRIWERIRPEVPKRRLRFLSWRPLAAAGAAAAAFLLVFWGYTVDSPDGLERVVRTGEEIRVPAQKRLELEWRDRGRVEMFAAARFRFVSGRGGERVMILKSGSLRVDASGPDSFFPVRTPAGEVRDIGTRYTVRTGRFEPDERGEFPCTVVEVEEGEVRLISDAGTTSLHPGQRGVMWKGKEPSGAVEIRPVSPERTRETVERVVAWLSAHPQEDPTVALEELVSLGETGVRDDSAWRFEGEPAETAERVRTGLSALWEE